MNHLTRSRSLFLFGGAIIATLLSWYSDPDRGMSTILGGLAIVQGVWAVAAAHWARKAVMDYPEANWRLFFGRAMESPVGAGLALIAGSIAFVGLLMVFAPRAHAGELPANAIRYLPMLKAEQRRLWPDHPDPALLAALVEQESCLSLKHRYCWSPTAQLKSAREEGAGVGQITRAYRADGTVRFDSLEGIRRQYAGEMGALSWNNVYTRPDLQLRAMVLMSRDAARQFRAAPAMLAFGDAAYNGGATGVQQERRACQLTAGCDAGQWFGHVATHCLKSRQPLYGGRNACDINREHVHSVMRVRRAKYVEAMS